MNTMIEEHGTGNGKGGRDRVVDVNAHDEETPSIGEERAQKEEGAAPDVGESTPVDDGGAVPDSASQPLRFLILIASVVELISTGDYYGWNIMEGSAYSKYAISVSAIPMVISFLEMVMPLVMPHVKILEDIHAKASKHMNEIVFVWIFVGTCFMTFREPFIETSNGYFAAWASAYGGAMMMGLELPTFDSNKVKAPASMMGLTASAAVVLVAAIEPMRAGCPPEGETAQAMQCHQTEATFALALAGFTIGLVMGMGKLDMQEMGLGKTDAEAMGAKMLHAKLEFLAMAIMAACWIAEAGVMTFRGPFDKTGNGYFGSWVGAATSTFVAFANLQAMQAMRGVSESDQEGTGPIGKGK